MKSLLLHLDDSPGSGVRERLALELALRLGAEVTAMYGAAVGTEDAPFAHSAGSTAIATALELEAARRERAHEEAMERAPPGTPALRWVDLGACDIADRLCREAAYADLLVLGQPERRPNGGGAPAGMVETVLLGSGRPALVVPSRCALSTCARRVLIAWNGSPQAARALTAALPVLRMADRIDVVGWSHQALAPRASGLDVSRYLALHGIDAEVRWRSPAKHVDRALADACAELDADLLVMGSYGHSRLHERVLGGATRWALTAATLPVLMNH